MAVVPHEFPIIAAGGGATPLSLERAAQQTQFMRIDLLVIDFGQGVMPVAQAAVFVVLFDAAAVSRMNCGVRAKIELAL